MTNIIPVNDLKEHIGSVGCECSPKVIFEEGEMIVVHNSYDRRELIEEAIEIINEETEEL